MHQAEKLPVAPAGKSGTSQQHLPAILLEGNQHLQIALSSAQMGAWDMDLVQQNTIRSLKHDQIFGYETPQPRWNRKILLEHVIPEDRNTVESRFEEALASGQFSMECRIALPDGSRRWIAEYGHVYCDAAGKPVRMSGMVMDVTARKRGEEELQRQSALNQEQSSILKAVLASIGDGVVVADMNGKFVLWNPAAQRIIGLGPVDSTPDEWTKIYGIYLPDGVTPYPGEKLPLARAIKGESVYADEQFLRHEKAPQGIWLSVTGKPLIDADGVQHGGVVVFNDITARKQSEEEIKKLNADLKRRADELLSVNQELEAFCYSVSHDLRAPLRSIDGFSQILLEDCASKLDADGIDALNRVRSATQRMGQLIDDMLDLSRVTRGEFNRSSADLSAMAKAIGVELSRLNPGQTVEFIVQDGISAVCDHRLIHAALNNLLSNAWKFTSKVKEPRVEFSALNQTDGTLAYCVRDNGAGFDMAYASKLFGVFQRLHSNRDFPGTGVGLATVQRIIRRHGGHVWAEGAINKGASFFFTLRS